MNKPAEHQTWILFTLTAFPAGFGLFKRVRFILAVLQGALSANESVLPQPSKGLERNATTVADRNVSLFPGSLIFNFLNFYFI